VKTPVDQLLGDISKMSSFHGLRYFDLQTSYFLFAIAVVVAVVELLVKSPSVKLSKDQHTNS